MHSDSSVLPRVLVPSSPLQRYERQGIRHTDRPTTSRVYNAHAERCPYLAFVVASPLGDLKETGNWTSSATGLPRWVHPLSYAVAAVNDHKQNPFNSTSSPCPSRRLRQVTSFSSGKTFCDHSSSSHGFLTIFGWAVHFAHPPSVYNTHH